MTRHRISDILNGKSIATFSGSLHAQFEEYFEALLDAESWAEEQEKFHQVYVKNEGFEAPLRKFLESKRSSVTAILGVAGVGKSTTLREMFGVLEAPSIARYDKNTLVIPFHFDKTRVSNVGTNAEVAIQNIITSGVLSAVEFTCEEADVTIPDLELVKFIKKHKRRLLSSLSLPRNSTDEEKIAWLRKTQPYSAVAEELKYVCHNSHINRVVILYDDLESCSYTEHKHIVLGALKLRGCMKSTGLIRRSYRVDTIFSCRPATFERLARDTNINGFKVRNKIHFESPVELGDILKSRLDYYVGSIGEGVISSTGEHPDQAEDIVKWKASYGTLREVIDRISDNHNDLIAKLSNYNLRDAQDELLEVLQNSRWYEVKNHTEGQLDIKPDNFHATDAGVIRALGLKFNNSFEPVGDAPIGNILFNFRSPDLDLCIVMCLRFLAEKSRNGKFRYVKQRDLRDALLVCYDEYKIIEFFDQIVEQLEWAGFVRLEALEVGAREASEPFLVTQNRGFGLLTLMKESSVLLELLRDNTFINFSGKTAFDGRGTGTTLLPPSERFIRVGEFIEQIAISERDLYNRAYENVSKERFSELFGDVRIAHRALLGFEKSIKRFYYNREKKRVIAPRAVSRKAKDIRQFLRGAQLLS